MICGTTTKTIWKRCLAADPRKRSQLLGSILVTAIMMRRRQLPTQTPPMRRPSAAVDDRPLHEHETTTIHRI